MTQYTKQDGITISLTEVEMMAIKLFGEDHPVTQNILIQK